jgi:hypothetical protein
VLVSTGFELVFKGDNGGFGLVSILVLLACSLDPMDLGGSRRTPLACNSLRLAHQLRLSQGVEILTVASARAVQALRPSREGNLSVIQARFANVALP